AASEVMMLALGAVAATPVAPFNSPAGCAEVAAPLENTALSMPLLVRSESTRAITADAVCGVALSSSLLTAAMIKVLHAGPKVILLRMLCTTGAGRPSAM